MVASHHDCFGVHLAVTVVWVHVGDLHCNPITPLVVACTLFCRSAADI